MIQIVGRSGVHKIYVTYGTSAGSAVTEKRLEAVCTYANGDSGLKECADAIFDHLPQLGAYAGAPPNGPSPIWMLYSANPSDPATESQCPGLARFVDAHFQMLGLGAGQIEYCYAYYNIGTGESSYVADPNGGTVSERWVTSAHPTEHAALSALERLFMVDSSGNLNDYEAALLFNGYYYALGVGRTFTTPRQVVRAAFTHRNILDIVWKYKIGNKSTLEHFDPTDWATCTVDPWSDPP